MLFNLDPFAFLQLDLHSAHKKHLRQPTSLLRSASTSGEKEAHYSHHYTTKNKYFQLINFRTITLGENIFGKKC